MPKYICFNHVPLWLCEDITACCYITPCTITSPISLCPLSGNIKPTARNLGVILDSDFTFIAHINKVVQSCFLHIRTISKIKHFLSQPDLEKVIHALIFSRLDYCNSLLTGINHKSLSRLQLVQNLAARLLTGFNRHHITPVLASLHWLPVRFRIDFKILLITFKARQGLAPEYITDMLTPYEPARSLRSAGEAFLNVPRSRLKTRGDRALERPERGDKAG